MTTIPFFGFIDYRRQHNIYTEGALSKLSKYFDLSGNRIIVIQDNQVQLKAEETSWKIIALKVASYVLLLPLTLPLFTIYAGLRYCYSFTLLSSPPQNQKTTLPSEKNQRRLPDLAVAAEQNRRNVRQSSLPVVSKQQSHSPSSRLPTPTLQSDKQPPRIVTRQNATTLPLTGSNISTVQGSSSLFRDPPTKAEIFSSIKNINTSKH